MARSDNAKGNAPSSNRRDPLDVDSDDEGEHNDNDGGGVDRPTALIPGYFVTSWRGEMSWLPTAPTGPTAHANERVTRAFAQLDRE